jgi:hypothetical protein
MVCFDVNNHTSGVVITVHYDKETYIFEVLWDGTVTNETTSLLSSSVFPGQRWDAMSSVRQYHTQAMEYAQRALIARHEGQAVHARDMARQAYELEVQALKLVPNDPSAQPTRAILSRSAASLAYQCDEFQQARALVLDGLQYAPPAHVRDELLMLLQQIDATLAAQAQPLRVLEDEETRVPESADTPEDNEAEYTDIQVEGIIDFASSRHPAEVMGLTTDEGKKYTIFVVEAMDEYVRTFYKRRVIVLGKTFKDSSKIFLDAIQNTS